MCATRNMLYRVYYDLGQESNSYVSAYTTKGKFHGETKNIEQKE